MRAGQGTWNFLVATSKTWKHTALAWVTPLTQYIQNIIILTGHCCECITDELSWATFLHQVSGIRHIPVWTWPLQVPAQSPRVTHGHRRGQLCSVLPGVRMQTPGPTPARQETRHRWLQFSVSQTASLKVGNNRISRCRAVERINSDNPREKPETKTRHQVRALHTY